MAAKLPTITTRIDHTTGRWLQGKKHMRLYFSVVSTADTFTFPGGIRPYKVAAQATTAGEWMSAIHVPATGVCTFGCSGAGIDGWLHFWV